MNNKILLAIIAVSTAIDEKSDISAFTMFLQGSAGIDFKIECTDKASKYIISAVLSLMESMEFKSRGNPSFDTHTLCVSFNFQKK